ncbi:Amylo-alpha-16-glucosidase [Aminomonas paucivorans DSM 12260]|uniref:Amylo-alpha-16-glucosidase n=1 Tax=Aminomonas paucivorans DSM 12260 TaxID=584708 RepID=E3D0S0_9BACT|nr:amylo-alpha-1,6-glucosidase [Aminomonas paucivorans]EFQ23891.1 Amylo-alpha-16-glucosidase [Aminomonas paucivorans DSM 12260]
MYLGKADVNTYDKGAGREVLISDGQGSYGFSTVIGANTRKAHGLLVVRPEGQSLHQVLASKVEETLFAHGKKYQLSTNRYKDLIYPDGFRYLQEYQASPIPSMLLVVHSILIRKSLFMPQGKGCTIVKYELLASPERVRMELRPLFAHRLNTELPQEGERPLFEAREVASGLRVEGRDLVSHVHATRGEWNLKPLWFDHLLYEQEDNASDVALEDLWSPGQLQVELEEGDSIYLVLSKDLAPLTDKESVDLEKETLHRLQSIAADVPLQPRSSLLQDLIHASYHLVDEGSKGTPAVYSGYPSVQNRARETFVALPGLLLSTGRERMALDLLRHWVGLANQHEGVVPSYIDPCGIASFEGADSGLWLLYAAQKTFEFMENPDGAADLWKGLIPVLDRYAQGIPSLDLECHENALLYLTHPHPGRHWMDGTTQGEPVVRRQGYLVEFGALWYNALRFGEQLGEFFGDGEKAACYGALADRCRESFLKVFWKGEQGALVDWSDPQNDQEDLSIRPNQILAVSLPSSPLDPVMGRSVVETCWNELYTTYGLRTLDPRHEKFKGRQEGRPDQRLKARFRGMAWPWLLGHFVSAYLRFNPNRRDIGWTFLRPFNAHMRHGCLGGVAEFFDGIMPYKPHGDVLSAASLGEILRVLQEDLLKPSV